MSEARNITIDKPEAIRALINGLHPFQHECLLTLGHYNGISYEEIRRLRPSIALATLYQAKQKGELKAHSETSSKTGFSWDAVHKYFESMGLA